MRHANDPHGWLRNAAECPTPAFSGAAGDLHRPARALVCHDATRSRPAQGPRQRRPLQSNVGPQVDRNVPYAALGQVLLLGQEIKEFSKECPDLLLIRVAG